MLVNYLYYQSDIFVKQIYQNFDWKYNFQQYCDINVIIELLGMSNFIINSNDDDDNIINNIRNYLNVSYLLGIVVLWEVGRMFFFF